MQKQLNLLYNRYKLFFRELDEFVDPRPSGTAKALMFLDSIIAHIMHGASPTDYIIFEFWRKSNRERSTFITMRRFLNMLDKYNDKKKTNLFRSKNEFNRVFSQFLKRSWLDLSSCTFEEFKEFIFLHKKVLIKPNRGFEGRGIHTLDFSKNDLDENALFEDLRKQKVIMEEVITRGVLSEFNPSSINSIRIVTLLTGDTTEIKYANIKMGRGDILTDNFGSGGIVAVVDANTGIIVTRGTNKKKEWFITHPTSGKQIIGYQIPRWEDIVNTVVAASKVVPEVRHVGWDVTINEAGEVVIIEGNDNSDRAIQLIDQVGRRKIFSA